MKILSHWIDSKDGSLRLQIQAETQQEQYDLIQYANHVKLPVTAYGKVDKSYTWAWFSIPLKKENYKLAYFGNDPEVTK